MREQILHYIWQNRLYDRLTYEDREVQVVQVGTYNDGDGPDFSLVKIQTPDLLWVGSVEIHLKSGDWYKHGHDSDPRYTGVLLHVVLEQDVEVEDLHGRVIPTAVLQVSENVLRRIEDLDVGHRALRCTPELSLISPSTWDKATAPLLPQRMECKIRKLSNGIGAGGALQFFYHALMRYMGAHLNNDAMEVTAHALSHSFLHKHASDRMALEAMLIGQARLIAEHPRDDYEARLREEYNFYRTKFGLTPVAEGLFRKLHIRPSSYPTRRLAMVAALIQREEELLLLMQHQKWGEIEEILATPPSEYWRTHIDFGQEGRHKMGGAGAETVLSLMVNVIIPTAYFYAISRGEKEEASAALSHLDTLPGEKNKITQLFGQNGIRLVSAADSQRALELYTEYCTRHRCLECPVAPEIFKSLHQYE